MLQPHATASMAILKTDQILLPVLPAIKHAKDAPQPQIILALSAMISKLENLSQIHVLANLITIRMGSIPFVKVFHPINIHIVCHDKCLNCVTNSF